MVNLTSDDFCRCTALRSIGSIKILVACNLSHESIPFYDLTQTMGITYRYTNLTYTRERQHGTDYK